MPRKRILRLELTAISHATEDIEKVRKVVEKLVPPNIRNKIVFETTKATGHHGNPITYIKVILEGQDAQDAFDWIIEKMEQTSKSLLKATIENRIQSESILHVRIHKQYLLGDRIVLWDGDESVKVTIRFTGKKSLIDELGEKGILKQHENTRGS